MKNSEAVDEELTASVTRPAPLIPPAPPDDKMLNTKELSMKATAAHLTAGVKELLLLDPPRPKRTLSRSGSYSKLEATPIFVRVLSALL